MSDGGRTRHVGARGGNEVHDSSLVAESPYRATADAGLVPGGMIPLPGATAARNGNT